MLASLQQNYASNSDLISVQPVDDLVTFVQNLLFVFVTDLAFQLLILHSGLHIEGIRLQAILGRHFLSLHIIFSLVLLRFLHHTLNVLLAQAT